MSNTALYTGLYDEYMRAKITLLKHISQQKTRKVVREYVQTVLALCTKRQAHLIATLLPAAFRVGWDESAEEIKAVLKAHKKKVASAAVKTPTDISFDFSKVSRTHLNKISRDTIGAIGNFNKEISKALLKEYDFLVANNQLVNSVVERGFTENTEAQLLKLGISKEVVAVIKSQSTTTKMIRILEMQGIRGGLHPDTVAKLLIPKIRAVFGDKGVTINNVGKTKKVLQTNAAGEYWFKEVKITRVYNSTVRNYASLISDTGLKQAQNTGRVASMKASGLVRDYRFVCNLVANSCCTCISLHGTIVTAMLQPPVHPRCHCYLSAVYKDNSLNLHSDEFYTHQKNAALWKEYKFRDFNSKLPRGEKIINSNYLPPDELRGMPSGKKLQKMLDTLF